MVALKSCVLAGLVYAAVAAALPANFEERMEHAAVMGRSLPTPVSAATARTYLSECTYRVSY